MTWCTLPFGDHLYVAIGPSFYPVVLSGAPTADHEERHRQTLILRGLVADNPDLQTSYGYFDSSISLRGTSIADQSCWCTCVPTPKR